MLVFDTETTGLIENMSTRSDHQPEVIEFCGMIIDPYIKGKVYDTYDKLIKPSMKITDEITRMNNIDNKMVAKAPSFREVAFDIRNMIEKSDVVVAHNAAFDRDMIDLEFSRINMTRIAWPHIICTIEATIHFTGYRLSLSALHEHLFGTKFEGAHRAKADVEALVRIVVELRKRGEI